MTYPKPRNADIRLATLKDVDPLVDLLWSVAAEGRWVGTEVPFNRNARHAMLAMRISGSHSVVLVADHDAEIVGNLTVDLTAYGVAEVGMLFASNWRGHGLGTALLAAGITWAVDAGAHKAALEVWPHNEAALALYRKAGFVEEGRLMRHYRRANGEVWDSIIMGLLLGPADR